MVCWVKLIENLTVRAGTQIPDQYSIDNTHELKEEREK